MRRLGAWWWRFNAWLDHHPKPQLWAGISVWAVTAVFTGLNFFDNRGLALAGKEAHDALCVFRNDLEERIGRTRAYLARHPEGFPALGITAGELANQLMNQQKTIDALKQLKCKEGSR